MPSKKAGPAPDIAIEEGTGSTQPTTTPQTGRDATSAGAQSSLPPSAVTTVAPPPDVVAAEETTSATRTRDDGQEEGRGIPKLRNAFKREGMSPEAAKRLHDELVARNIRSYADARTRVGEIVSVLQFALRVDAQRIVSLYEEIER